MAISWGRRAGALAVGLLVVLLVLAGATPAAAGPGPDGSGGGRGPSGPQGGDGDGGRTGQQVRRESAPAARKNEGSAPRPTGQRATAPRTAARPAVTASATQPPAAMTPEPAPRQPAPEGKARRADRADDVRRQSSAPAPVERPTTAVRPSAISPAQRTFAPLVRPSLVRATARSAAAGATTAAESTTTASLAAPPVLPAPAAAIELEPRQLWPSLPGAAGHPAFPGLLAAVLIGFALLGIRGDRRDPKLAAAAIDDRGDRAEFR